MGFGAGLARQYEYDKFLELKLPVDVYSPVQNKSINDKSSVTEEENNKLAEKITAADIERLWNSDFVVIEPAQTAVGSMCELGTLFGWKYMAEQLKNLPAEEMKAEVNRIADKDVYCHYFDIRNTQLNEKGWRRSHSINQLLYGMILYVEKYGDIETLEEIFQHLVDKYGVEE